MSYQEKMEQQYRETVFSFSGLEFDQDELCHRCPRCKGCPDHAPSSGLSYRHGNKFAAKSYVGLHPDHGMIEFTDLRAFAASLAIPEHRLRHALYNHKVHNGWQIRYLDDGPDYQWLTLPT